MSEVLRLSMEVTEVRRALTCREVETVELRKRYEELLTRLALMASDVSKAAKGTTYEGMPPVREGTEIARIRELILHQRRAVYLDEVVNWLNRPLDNKSRAAVAALLSTYKKKGMITRPKPNHFYLSELEGPMQDAA